MKDLNYILSVTCFVMFFGVFVLVFITPMFKKYYTYAKVDYIANFCSSTGAMIFVYYSLHNYSTTIGKVPGVAAMYYTAFFCLMLAVLHYAYGLVFGKEFKVVKMNY